MLCYDTFCSGQFQHFSTEAQSVIWQAADACTKPFHLGSDNHGKLLRSVCFWIVYREGLKLLSNLL